MNITHYIAYLLVIFGVLLYTLWYGNKNRLPPFEFSRCISRKWFIIYNIPFMVSVGVYLILSVAFQEVMKTIYYEVSFTVFHTLTCIPMGIAFMRRFYQKGIPVWGCYLILVLSLLDMEFPLVPEISLYWLAFLFALFWKGKQ